MRNNLEIYESLRKSGHSEEEALSETKAFLNASNGTIDDLVTKKDLKIALWEFAKEYKLEALNMKMNLVLWALGATLGGFGFVFKILFEILSKLPK